MKRVDGIKTYFYSHFPTVKLGILSKCYAETPEAIDHDTIPRQWTLASQVCRTEAINAPWNFPQSTHYWAFSSSETVISQPVSMFLQSKSMTDLCANITTTCKKKRMAVGMYVSSHKSSLYMSKFMYIVIHELAHVVIFTFATQSTPQNFTGTAVLSKAQCPGRQQDQWKGSSKSQVITLKSRWLGECVTGNTWRPCHLWCWTGGGWLRNCEEEFTRYGLLERNHDDGTMRALSILTLDIRLS